MIDRTPEMVLDASDPNEHLIQMPMIARLGSATLQSGGEGLSKLPAPASDRLLENHHTAFGQHQLDVPEAQAERVIQPDRMADDFGRKTVTMVRIRDTFHPATMPHANAFCHPIRLT
jgi:hypothetical protein